MGGRYTSEAWQGDGGRKKGCGSKAARLAAFTLKQELSIFGLSEPFWIRTSSFGIVDNLLHNLDSGYMPKLFWATMGEPGPNPADHPPGGANQCSLGCTEELAEGTTARRLEHA